MDKMELLKPMEHRQSGWYWYGLGLVAIMLTGLALRLYSIGSESLWLDEGFSTLAATQPTLRDVLTFIFREDLHPPLYYLLLHFWIGWFGDSESAMRILSAIFGTLSLPLVVRLGRDMMDRKTASLAALLAAICVYHVFFGQEVRGYSLFALLALLSMVFWVRLFVRPGFGVVAGYLACTILTLYSHPYGVFHVVCQNVMFVVLWLLERPLRLGWPGWIGIQSLLGLAFSPWIAVTLRKVGWVHQGQASMLIPSIWDIPGALKAFAGDADFIATWSGERFWLGGLFSALMLAGLWPARWGRKIRPEESGIFQDDSPVRRRGVVLVSVWLACTILIPYIVTALSVPVFSNRYMVSGSFAFLLLVARGVGQVPGRPLRWVVGVGILLSQAWMLVPYYTQVNKEQWREVVSYVESRAQSGDVVLFHAPYCKGAIYWYYARRDDFIYKGYPSRSDPRRVNPKTIQEELLPLLESRDRVCLILAHSFDKDGLIRKALDQEYVCTDSRQFYRVSAWFYERKVAAPTPSAPTDPNLKGR
jgi:mannosyltransferase